MADFDQFEGAVQETVVTEEDPAAEFLAREQTELAGLDDDNFDVDSSAQAQQNNNFDSFGDQSGTQQDFTSDQDIFGGSDGGMAPVCDSSLGADNSTAGGLFDGGDNLTNGPSDGYSAISQMDEIRAEPEKIKKWREEQKDRLEKKDVEEEEKQEKWLAAARKELEDWYKHHAEQLEKTKENNRAAEDAFVKERDESIPGQQWEKICRLCEFNPKNMKSSKDVSRMRSLLLQLKQTPLVR
ncbi:clathrin light chain B-like isoform X1 [Gigantopelta aegis]|uniref:clathrin light chain B-like isoform X1 n=1 Tax=Gigantopelta aegis TaxID=1735272 RepID=UPI001B88BC2C|nr:clathrin light chain B-like isoform X1 [Gigantopelta aegis]